MTSTTTPSLHCTALGRHFVSPLMNAAGVMCSNKDELDAVRASAAGTHVTKSCTQEPRQGNPEPRYSPAPLGSINSMGLPNLGFQYYLDYALDVCKKAAAAAEADKESGDDSVVAKKPVFFSVAGMTFQEVVHMCKTLSEASEAAGSEFPAPILELNLSCPNVPGKPQVAYDFKDMDIYLTAVSEVYKGVFGVKLPPYFDMSHFDAAAAVINKHDKVAFVTCINSVGNTLVVDVETESVLIKPKDGFGGLGGAYVLPVALSNVRAFYTRCPTKLVFGCGGVQTGADAFAHILAGASLVQIGTALYEEGAGVFERVNKELAELMKKKGYSSLEDFRGKLKSIE